MVDVLGVPAWLTSFNFPLLLILAGLNQKVEKNRPHRHFSMEESSD
jgi:hypothetical protein